MSIAAACMLWGAVTTAAFSQLASGSSGSETSRSPQATLDRLQKETAARPDWIEGWWNLGTAAYDAERFDLSIHALRHVVEVQPRMGIAWDLLGLSQFELKQFADARISLEHGVALGPIEDTEVQAVAIYHLGMLRIRDSDFEGARDILQKSFSQNPNPQVQLAIGLAVLRVPLLPGEIDASHEALLISVAGAASSGEAGLPEFQKILAANQTVPMLRLAYAQALQKVGRTDEAIQQLRFELEVSPQSPVAWNALATAERRHGDAAQASMAASKASAWEKEETRYEERSRKWFGPQSVQAGGNTLADGMRAYAAGQYAQAAQALSAWVTSHPDDGTAWAVLGLSEYKLAENVNARLHLTRGIALGLHADARAAASAHYTLGVLLLQASNFEDAAAQLSTAHTLDSTDRGIEEALGCVLLRRTDCGQKTGDPLTTKAGAIELMLRESRYEQAFPAFQSLIASYPLQPNLHWAFGTALIALSEFDQAAEQMRAEQKISPSNPLPYIGLASISLRQHRPAEAIEDAQRAVALSPETAEPHYLLGRALLESHASVLKAVAELERAESLSPDSPEVHFSLAKAYARNSMPERAAQERATFSHLNELRQAQNGSKADQSYAGPKEAEVLSDASAHQTANR